MSASPSSHDASSQAEKDANESPNNSGSPTRSHDSWQQSGRDNSISSHDVRSRESGSNDGGSQRADDSGHGASSWRTDTKEGDRNTWEDKDASAKNPATRQKR